MRVPVTRPCLSRPVASPWTALRRPDLAKRTPLVKRPLPTKSTLRPESEVDKKLLDLEDQQGVKNESSGILSLGVKEKTPLRDIGVFWLCFTNVFVFVLDHVLKWKWISQLYLYHASPRWWQFITSAFCHASWEHLSSNLFLLYVFGKLVEEQEGAIGVWSSYIICALGGSIVSYFTYPSTAISLGASGAVFGLFTVSVLIRLSWNLKNLFEVCILGQFVIARVLQEVGLQLSGGTITTSGSVSHLAHLGGALVGVFLIILLKQIPDPDTKP